jgi:hypothetical protein
MRKLFVLALLAGVTVLGAAACKSDSPTAPSATTGAAAAGKDTAAVCAEAKVEFAAWGAQLSGMRDEVVQAIAANDQAKLTQLQLQLATTLATWQAKLSTWQARDVDPDVKAVLTDFSTAITDAASPNGQMSTDQVQAKFTELSGRLATACG